MTWIWRYRIHLYLRNAVWIPPILGMVAALFAAAAVRKAESVLKWESRLDPETARTVLITLASSMFTFIVFVSSMMLLALQLASAQLTPRAIAIVLRDPVAKLSSAVFVFTFTFLIVVVVRIDASVPLLTARLASYTCMLSLGVFFYLIGHMGKALRPSEVLRSVAMEGRQAIESVYPRRLARSAGAPPESQTPVSGTSSTIVPAHVDGTLLACDVPGIALLAERAGCVVELVPQIGDSVAAGDPLFGIVGQAAPPLADELRRMVAIGHERTMEQDPAFAFRIIVDIACKALSPAINDSTTAILAIDQIHHLLHEVGQRRLDDDRVLDATGRPRLIYRPPGWEDFVHLALTEIRHYGRESIQVTRRLRAMLENLIQTLPEDRASLLRQELGLLHRSVARFFPDPEDQTMADVSDSQGVGGRAESSARPGGATRHVEQGAGHEPCGSEPGAGTQERNAGIA